MATFDRRRLAAQASRLAASARGAASSLKADYEAGRRGDETPVTPLWASPREQYEAVLRLIRGAPGQAASTDDDPTADAPIDDGPASERDAQEVAAAMGSVDWSAVRTATSERSADVGRAVRSMAAEVDWQRLQPVAGQVSSALIAAVAAGRIPLGGRTGSVIARAIVDQGGLGRLVGDELRKAKVPVPTGFREAIEVYGREIP